MERYRPKTRRAVKATPSQGAKAEVFLEFDRSRPQRFIFNPVCNTDYKDHWLRRLSFTLMLSRQRLFFPLGTHYRVQAAPAFKRASRLVRRFGNLRLTLWKANKVGAFNPYSPMGSTHKNGYFAIPHRSIFIGESLYFNDGMSGFLESAFLSEGHITRSGRHAPLESVVAPQPVVTLSALQLSSMARALGAMSFLKLR